MNAQQTIRQSNAVLGGMERLRESRWHHRMGRGFICQFVHGLVWFSVLGTASYVIATHYVAESVRVSGTSMAPTINDSDCYFLEHLTYLWRAPQRGDIVVIRDPTDGSYSIKRIVATQGDLVYINDGQIHINGRLVNEPYLPAGTRTWACASRKRQVIKCRKNEVAVLGDNRDNSWDSRYYGPISHRDILGLVFR
jgi:signal peptidase I